MIKKNLKTLIITSIVILLPIIAGLILWHSLPDPMPAHWNTAGEVDGWVPKWVFVTVIPLCLMALQWIGALVSSADPKQKNITNKSMSLGLWIMPVLSIFMNTMVYLIALGYKISVEVIVPAFMGMLLVFIGNYLPKCKQTYTIGIKLPWTLEDEENWNKTHRMAGKLWVVCGLVIIALAFLECLWAMIAVFALMVMAPTIYSYALSKKDTKIEA
jgi:uncharacterized membrane protein